MNKLERGTTIERLKGLKLMLLVCLLPVAVACASSRDIYFYEDMDFGAIETVAVMPFNNLSRDSNAGDRVRDTFMTKLLAAGAFYVVPAGEVARGLARSEVQSAGALGREEIVKLGGILKVQAIIVGVVKEYGEFRAGSTSANAISLSAQMIETETGRIVWSADSSKGGIGISDRLFGGGAKPMDGVTEQAVDELIRKLLGSGAPRKEAEKSRPAAPQTGGGPSKGAATQGK